MNMKKIFWDAATQRNINKQVSDVASLGGDAVFAAPGKVMNVVRIATGSTMIASGIQSVKQGKKQDEALFRLWLEL